MILSKLLQERRIALGFKSQRALAREATKYSKTKIPSSAIQELEDGTRTTSIHLPAIAQALRTTVDYLMTGRLVAPPEPTGKDVVEFLGSLDAVPMIPIIGWDEVSESKGKNMQQKKFERVPFIGQVGKKARALIIKNDSMVSLYPNSDTFRPGDCIIIDPDKPYENGCFVVATIDGHSESIFRQLIEIGGSKFLQPLNPAFPRQPLDGSVTIDGVLVGSFRTHH